jgi:hypothetical protein
MTEDYTDSRDSDVMERRDAETRRKLPFDWRRRRRAWDPDGYEAWRIT